MWAGQDRLQDGTMWNGRGKTARRGAGGCWTGQGGARRHSAWQGGAKTGQYGRGKRRGKAGGAAGRGSNHELDSRAAREVMGPRRSCMHASG